MGSIGTMLATRGRFKGVLFLDFASIAVNPGAAMLV